MASKPRKPDTKPTEEPRISRGSTRPGAIFPVAPPASTLPETYAATLQQIKTHLRNSRIRAILAANPIVIEAYWHTGKIILARQQEAAWGAKVIDRLAAGLQEAFPDMDGLSSRNLLSMKLFAEAFPESPIAKQPVSQLLWGQIIRLIQMVKDSTTHDFYIRETLAHHRPAALSGKEQTRRRVCPARLGSIHRRRRLANAAHRIPPRGNARQPAQHRGNRSRTRQRHSSRVARITQIFMTTAFENPRVSTVLPHPSTR